MTVISVVGNIGSGKSTIVGRLAEALDATDLVERFDRNPFLSDFYYDPQRWVFVSQTWFTVEAMERAIAAQDLPRAVMEHGPQWIMDVMTGSMRGTALTGEELALMDRFTTTYQRLAEPLQPTVIVALDADTDTLLARIRDRGRKFEDQVTSEALEAIRERSEAFLAEARKRVPVVPIDTTQVDGRTSEGIRTIVDLVMPHIGSAGNAS